jgi:predicted ATPase
MDRDQSLLDLVFDRLAKDDLPDEVVDLILAAYAGDDQLDSVLAGRPVELPTRDSATRPRPQPLYLESVTVAGFRGVGPKQSLRLQPHAGLTLVVGRNGSGKSSYAEAVELALTGDSARWAERSGVFKEGWRNLHSGSPCEIEVLVRADGATTPIRVRRAWRDEHTDAGQGTTTVVADGQRYTDTADVGWPEPLKTYRPFLTASDLGRLVTSTPSGLFDALAPILGIDPVVNADKRLLLARKELADRAAAVKTARQSLRTALGEVDDDRARAAAAILAKRTVDLPALDKLLSETGSDSHDPVAAAARRLVAATLPETGHVAQTADDIDTAAQRVATLAASRTGTAERAAHLLQAAVTYHDEHGDGPCPVCGTGTLDAGWHGRATETLSTLRQETAAVEEANATLRDARARGTRPLSLNRLIADDVEAVASAPGASAVLAEQVDRLRAALADLCSAAADLASDQLAAHLRSAYPPAYAAFAATQAAANDWLRQRHDAWREHAAALQEWLGRAREADTEEPVLARINAARTWLKAAAAELRGQRLAPFAQQSQQIWDELRQESNVELSGMRLDGSNTQRRVAFPATVDGTATSAMAVMSQGELQALGLAVFLPRACAEASPFRFLIIDDPVQSMDPSKVDGLAQVLASLAQNRQVVVFTHDNRLPEAVRRLRIEATAWEVTRRDGSVVEIRKNADPVARYLADARSLLKAGELADNVRYPLVSGFCRSAVEAACHERIRRERIGRGERHADVEVLIEKALTLNQVTALALFGDMDRGGQVLGRLNRFGGWAADAFQACKEGVHGAGKVELPVLVEDTRRLTDQLR